MWTRTTSSKSPRRYARGRFFFGSPSSSSSHWSKFRISVRHFSTLFGHTLAVSPLFRSSKNFCLYSVVKTSLLSVLSVSWICLIHTCYGDPLIYYLSNSSSFHWSNFVDSRRVNVFAPFSCSVSISFHPCWKIRNYSNDVTWWDQFSLNPIADGIFLVASFSSSSSSNFRDMSWK